jgi:hypothetical protein
MEMDNHRITKVLFQDSLPPEEQAEGDDGTVRDNPPDALLPTAGGDRPADDAGEKVVEFDKGAQDARRKSRS